MHQLIFDLFIEITKAWREGNPKIRRWIYSAAFLIGIGSIVLALIDAGVIIPEIGLPAAASLIGFGSVICLIIYARQKSLKDVERERKIEAIEKRYEDNPRAPQAAWDLARVKLEVYLDRNVKQVRAIFWLTVFVMCVGFLLIGIGIIYVFKAPNVLAPSIVAACAGVVVNVIGATFLVVYKSTMEQAKDYVTILERINAVGMSVQILDGIDSSNPDLKAQATADLAKQLLSLYSNNSSSPSGRKKT